MTPEQKKKFLKAKIAVALHDELGRVPKDVLMILTLSGAPPAQWLG